MAIYHYSVQVISRSQGRSAVAAAAYRSGENLVDDRTNETKYYHRTVQPETAIFAPENSPEWVRDRERLWNEVEKAEKRKDAQLCREINVALPNELTRDQQRELLKNFVQDQFVQKGMIADVAIHRDDKDNPHAHIMLTMREIDEDGFGKKNRDWNRKEELEKGREEWANYANRALEKNGQEERITHLSHEARGLEQLPTVHLGHTVNAMEKRGVQTERGNVNREREEYNRVVADLQKYREEKQAILEKQKAEKLITPAEKVNLQKAENLLKAPVNLPNIEQRREQLNKWENRLDDQYSSIQQKAEDFRTVQNHFEVLSSTKKENEKLHAELKDIKWNPFKAKENKQLKEQYEQAISRNDKAIEHHENKIQHYGEKLGFTDEKDFLNKRDQFQDERPGLIEQNQKQRKAIQVQHDILNKAENAYKNAFVRQVASNYPERPEMQYMKYSEAQKLNNLNNQYGKPIPVETIEKTLHSRKQEVQRLQGEINRVESNTLRLQRAGNYLKEYEKHDAVVKKYENNPLLKGKMLISKSAKHEYDHAVTARSNYQDLMKKEGITGRPDFEKQVNILDKMESKVPEFKGAIQSQERGTGLLDAVMKGVEQAGREMQKEQARQERERQRANGKGKNRTNFYDRER
ncbi:MobQ family relaxase [Cytobacillus firmus]|uniref:Mob/TraA nicking n=1 Tax=Cytobacillus firmus DS1 TaxID=1307436 RepID=W7KYH7_CYTFI|nr:MobQ family relaxase [Cytobacillus firmus]EWG08401.1 Mob/TraA nicking [Cytobacillus firmus DS1]